MLLVGYCYGLRSERRLCDGSADWGSKALFRRLFEEIVARCMRAGLVGGEGFAIDASVIEADASSGRKVDGKLITWLETEKVARLVREYLAALDQAAVAEAAKSEDVDTGMPPGNPPAPPKVTSLSDPTAAWTNKGQRKVGFAYGTNYLIDLQRAIIVDVEATPARWSAEVAATKTMLEQTQCPRPPPAAAGGRCRLRIGIDDRLADAARDRAAYSAARPRTRSSCGGSNAGRPASDCLRLGMAGGDGGDFAPTCGARNYWHTAPGRITISPAKSIFL
jgi:hypothetical protein